MEKGLVNILTPAYNCASLIHRLLDSILEQTYPQIEMFVVDDGSTDETANVVKSYIQKFSERGYKLNYIFQTNQGQSYAINNGLKLLNGEYLLWPDSDDWYKEPTSIQNIIDSLSETDDSVGIARCQYERIEEESMNTIHISKYPKKYHVDYLFDDAAMGNNGFFWEPGGYAIKLKFLDKFIKCREIYVSKHAGQNIQMLLPYFYYSKCLTLHITLFCYLIRKNSHSRGSYTGFDRLESRELCHRENFEYTISSLMMNDDDKRDKYINYINIKYYHELFSAAIQYQIKDKATDYYEKLKHCKYRISFKEMFLFKNIGKNNVTNRIYRKLKSKSRTIILLYSLFFFLFMGLLLVIDFQSPSIARAYYKYSFKGMANSNAIEFEKQVYCGVLNQLERKYVSDHAIIYQKAYHETLFGKKISVFEFGEYGLLMHYAFLYAKQNNDNELMLKIREKFDLAFCKQTDDIVRTDQVTYGNVAIDLYKYTKDLKYKLFADKIFSLLDSIDQKNGILLYRSNTRQQEVDAIGLVCPFLSSYAKEFKSERAMDIAKKMCEDYIRWGADPVTGIPVQSYNVDSHVKCNRSNWGRGISWYLLGTMSIPQKEYPIELKSRINILEETLLQNKTLIFNQYFGQGELPDMSATVPLLWYLYYTHRVKFTKKEIVKMISPYFDETGIMRWCSPTIGMPFEAPNAWQSNMAFQGLTLYFLSLLRDIQLMY